MINRLIEFIKSNNLPQQDQKSPKYLKFVLPVVSLFIGLILTIFVIIPQIINYLKIQSQIQDTRGRIDSLIVKINLLSSIPLQNYQQELTTALEALPIEKDYIPATTIIQTLATNTRVQLTNVNFLEGSVEGYQIKIELLGPQTAIKDFLDKINTSPRIFKITALDLSPEKANSFTASVTILAPFATLPNEIGKVDAPVNSLTPEDQQLLAKLDQSFTGLTGPLTPATVTSGSFLPKSDPFE